MKSANRGRVAAARALLAVEDGGHVEEALARLAPADPADRSLAFFLALGVLRRRSHVDAALRPGLKQPLGALDASVRATLRVGAFELLYARTPPHAALHQAVEVARAVGAGRASGLVNAVLRRVRPPEGLSRADALDHPPWLVARWSARYGDAATDSWCARNNTPPALFAVTPDDGEALAARWREAGLNVSPAALHGASLPGVWRVDDHSGVIPDLAGFAEGGFWIQDAASAAVADLVPVAPGARVLDACAAPGGKSFRLAARGADVLAVDLDPERLARVAESTARLGLSIALRAHDWLTGPLDVGTFDAVLVDAPCTALGLVRRHPEIRWRRQLLDVLRAPERQRRILEAASTHVAPGGALVYAVCSPEPEEGTDVIAAFLAAHPAFVEEARLSTAPPEGDEDAFFGARLRRTA